MSSSTVLCVDADPDGRATMREALAPAPGLEVLTAADQVGALETLRERDVDCVVTAFDLPDGNGVALVEATREVAPDTVCVLFTDADRDRVAAAGDGTVVAEHLRRSLPDAGDRLRKLVVTATTLRSQTAYPLPPDEAERLAELERHDLGAASLGPRLDRVATLAARHFGVPQATVNVLRESVQEFVACHGEAWSSIPREDSVCTYAILEDEPVTVVEDTAADPRFAENEVLAELGIRFYAGAVVRGDEGRALGTLCVYDEAPGTLEAADREYLALLAETAGDLVALHAAGGDA